MVAARILLYDDDPYIRMSYPDLVEEGGRFYVTETQKTVGRVHEIPSALLDGLFNQFDNRAVAKDGLALDLGGALPAEAKMPVLPALNRRAAKSDDQRGEDLRVGFTFELWLDPGEAGAAQVLLDCRDGSGKGILVSTTRGTVRLAMNDGRQEAGWESDRGALQAGQPQHVVVTVDGGPKIITVRRQWRALRWRRRAAVRLGALQRDAADS